MVLQSFDLTQLNPIHKIGHRPFLNVDLTYKAEIRKQKGEVCSPTFQYSGTFKIVFIFDLM